jgi:hypothetical protein
MFRGCQVRNGEFGCGLITAVVAVFCPFALAHAESTNGGDDREIARQSARASERQADYAEIGLWIGGFAAFATALAALEAAAAARAAAGAADESRRANEIAKEANALSRHGLVQDKRAWLSVSDDVKLLEPTSLGEDGAIIRVCFTIKNMGATPAFKVAPRINAVFLASSDKNYQEHWKGFMRECRSTFPGQMLFPGDTFTLAERQPYIDGPALQRAINTNALGASFLDLIILIGVGYKIAGDDDTVHITCEPRAIKLQIAKGQTTPFHNVEVPSMPFIGGYAD